jgi:Flp pilus assembly protein TadB
MAQTKKKRRRKHRGTQGGKVDTRPRGKPRNRAEAKQRAASRRTGGSGKRAAASTGRAATGPPTWASAAKKGLVAALIFFALLALAFGRPVGASLGIALFMVVFYVPMAYFTDRFFYNRQLAKADRERQAKAQGGE